MTGKKRPEDRVNTPTANHKRVRLYRGRAGDQLCVVGQDHAAYDWSWIHDTDPSQIENYRPMCRKHHQEYDGVQRKQGDARRGRKMTLSDAERQRRREWAATIRRRKAV